MLWCHFGLGVLFLGVIVLSKQLQNVEVFLLQVDLFLLQATRHNFDLFPDWLGPTVNFLEHNLHHSRLELGQHLHFGQSLFSFAFLLFRSELAVWCWVKVPWHFYVLDYSIRVLIFTTLYAFLDVLWVVFLQRVGLTLETIVKVSQILNVVLHSLRPLLLFGERNLEHLAGHSTSVLLGFHCICNQVHLLSDETNSSI